MGFDYNPDAGVKFIGKVARAREITVAEFDAEFNATLGNKFSPDEIIFLYMVENLEARAGTFRHTFFSPDNAPVSKWTRFKRAHQEINVPIKRNPDGTTNLEGRYFVVEEKELKVGKYGTTTILIPIDIPTPEDVDVLEKSRAEAVTGEYAPPQDNNEIAQVILGLADGLGHDDIMAQTTALGYPSEAVNKVYSELLAKGSITTGADGLVKVI